MQCPLIYNYDQVFLSLYFPSPPTTGLVLNVTKLREVSLAKSLPIPWATTLVSMTLSNIRTDPSTPSHPHTGTPSGATQNSKIGTVHVLYQVSTTSLITSHYGYLSKLCFDNVYIGLKMSLLWDSKYVCVYQFTTNREACCSM